MSVQQETKSYFSKVRIAREILRERAAEILDAYLEVIKEARAVQDFKTASQMLQWLIEHTPSEDDGTRSVDASVDKQPQQIQQDTRPMIQIGVQIGGVKPLPPTKQTKSLPPVEGEVIKNA